VQEANLESGQVDNDHVTNAVNTADKVSPISALLAAAFAVVKIQRYYRKFSARRKQRIEEMKQLAENESMDSRDKLRKRRMGRHRPVIIEDVVKPSPTVTAELHVQQQPPDDIAAIEEHLN